MVYTDMNINNRYFSRMAYTDMNINTRYFSRMVYTDMNINTRYSIFKKLCFMRGITQSKNMSAKFSLITIILC
jgi:hypothetical protein